MRGFHTFILFRCFSRFKTAFVQRAVEIFLSVVFDFTDDFLRTMISRDFFIKLFDCCYEFLTQDLAQLTQLSGLLRAWTRFSVVQQLSWEFKKQNTQPPSVFLKFENIWNYGFDENPDSAWIWNWDPLLAFCGLFAISDIICIKSRCLTRTPKYQIKVVSGSIKTWIILKLLVWAHALVFGKKTFYYIPYF